MGLYSILNIGFFVFHTALILFNLLGWIWEKTRLWNLISLGMTGLSWFGLGFWYGFGYCPSTQWHWQVRLRLGYRDMSGSYIQFLVQKLLGVQANAVWVDALTVVLFFMALSASITLNIRGWRCTRSQD